jgi:hypothetical protein
MSLEFAGFGTLPAQCGCLSQVRHLAPASVAQREMQQRSNPAEASREPLNVRQ